MQRTRDLQGTSGFHTLSVYAIWNISEYCNKIKFKPYKEPSIRQLAGIGYGLLLLER